MQKKILEDKVVHKQVGVLWICDWCGVEVAGGDQLPEGWSYFSLPWEEICQDCSALYDDAVVKARETLREERKKQRHK